MSRSIRLKIIIPVNTDEFTKQISESVDRFRSDTVSIDLEHIREGTPYIESRIDLTINAPHVLKMAVETESQGYDGIFVTDMDMCGVEASRQAIKIPIIGGFRPSLYTAMFLGQKVSILTVNDVLDLQNEHIRAFGTTENLASIIALDVDVNALKNPTPANKAKVLESLFDGACTAITRDGADCLMFGCTGFTDFAQALSDRLTVHFGAYVPVMDPNCCAIGYLIMLVQNRLSQSGISYPYLPTIPSLGK